MEKADNENAGLPVILDRQDSRRAFFKGLRELNRRYGTTHSLTVVEP